ncbi:conserved hypothetical protein [Leishmania major strain Friedlin]|uniref:Methyltransferase domain-containing protein n=1 Tax=Leishmania major TaxID=5664 RepID=Q95Z88_LEIMA|nr:conserved hypothetical protein [Leishmania major strain Friedlin]CAC44915.1 conserved hypothetical protein [Leishmania major strain Friedlin]CAG9567659.1 hypothetical_protein_-_conserved [Leishmania major strain Friedlin]|eukprot:XP_888518.1 conserved hypothetical protein [Leishmania major strain Friedlin]
MMEPTRNAEYSKQEYWDRRYTEEEHYDWFPSVYPMCVAAAFETVEAVYRVQRSTGAFNGTLKVLHLGTGNSTLCADIRATYEAKYPTEDSRPYRLVQAATDYSAVVIDRMQAKYGLAHPLEDVHWVVADIRDLSRVREQFGPFFDVVLDKGTMDALQADKANQNMEDDIERMLCEVSRCVEGGAGTRVYRVFVQITWEIPYLRLYYTTRNATHTFAWGTNVTYRFLGESDMYRVYTYEVSPPSSE